MVKLKLYFAFLLSFTLTAVMGQSAASYSISGRVNCIDSGSLRMLSADANTVLDSSAIENGRFRLHGNINSPQRLLFNVSPGNWNFRAFVENSNISIEVDSAGAQYFGAGENRWALIWEVEEKGSEMADVYSRCAKETNRDFFRKTILDLRNRRKGLIADQPEASKLARQVDSLVQEASAKQKSWIDNFVKVHPSSIAGPYLFYEYNESFPATSPDEIDSVLIRFTDEARQSVYFGELSAMASTLRGIQPGSAAPDFALRQRDSSMFRLESIKGDFTLIDFWASWCVPCRKSIPGWKQLYAKYSGRGFKMVSVSGDRRRADWLKALEKEQMPWTQVIDEFPRENAPARVSELFGVDAIPFYVLLDEYGTVVLATGDEKVMRNKIREVFSGLTNAIR